MLTQFKKTCIIRICLIGGLIMILTRRDMEVIISDMECILNYFLSDRLPSTEVRRISEDILDARIKFYNLGDKDVFEFGNMYYAKLIVRTFGYELNKNLKCVVKDEYISLCLYNNLLTLDMFMDLLELDDITYGNMMLYENEKLKRLKVEKLKGMDLKSINLYNRDNNLDLIVI